MLKQYVSFLLVNVHVIGKKYNKKFNFLIVTEEQGFSFYFLYKRGGFLIT